MATFQEIREAARTEIVLRIEGDPWAANIGNDGWVEISHHLNDHKGADTFPHIWLQFGECHELGEFLKSVSEHWRRIRCANCQRFLDDQAKDFGPCPTCGQSLCSGCVATGWHQDWDELLSQSDADEAAAHPTA